MDAAYLKVKTQDFWSSHISRIDKVSNYPFGLVSICKKLSSKQCNNYGNFYFYNLILTMTDLKKKIVHFALVGLFQQSWVSTSTCESIAKYTFDIFTCKL